MPKFPDNYAERWQIIEAVTKERHGTYADDPANDYWVGKDPDTGVPLPGDLALLDTTPKLPSSWAAELIRFWAWHVDKMGVSSSPKAPHNHRQAFKNLVGLQVYGSRPESVIPGFQAQLFWNAQRKLAAALTGLSPWTSPSETVIEVTSKAAAKAAELARKGAGEVLIPTLGSLKWISIGAAVLGVAYLAGPYIRSRLSKEES